MRRVTGILFSSGIGITNSGHLAYPGRDGLRPTFFRDPAERNRGRGGVSIRLAGRMKQRVCVTHGQKPCCAPKFLDVSKCLSESKRAGTSVVQHYLDTVAVRGSNPLSRTTASNYLPIFTSLLHCNAGDPT